MNEIEWIKSHDRAAAAPQVDVANAVLRDIRQREVEVPPLPWLAGAIATLAGAGSIAVALQLYFAAQDPLNELLDSFRLVLQ